MALVACEGGTRVNTAGNPVHFTGIAWAGGHGEPTAGGARSRARCPVASGACLAIPLARWRAARRLPGAVLPLPRGRRPLVPAPARGRHGSGSSRRRSSITTTSSAAAPQQVALAGAQPLGVPDPRLPGAAARSCWPRRCCATELVAARRSRSPAAGAARSCAPTSTSLRWLPRLLRERRAIQARRAVSSAEFATWLTPDLDSPFIPGFARSGPLRLALRAYWRLVRLLLGRPPGAERPE